VLAAAAFGHFDPVVKAILIIICGGIALASNSSKGATLLAVNHSPEPFSNVGLSLLEDALIPAGMWLSLKHPEVALGLVAAFLFLFLWLAPKIFRAVRLQLAALGALLRSWSGSDVVQTSDADQENAAAFSGLSAGAQSALRGLARAARPIPEKHARRIEKALRLEAPAKGVRAAATKKIRGLGNSVGYLVVHRIPFSEMETSRWKRGLLLNQFGVKTTNGDREFYVFKDVNLQEAPAAARAEQSARLQA
jgi:hypothetical protein